MHTGRPLIAYYESGDASNLGAQRQSVQGFLDGHGRKAIAEYIEELPEARTREERPMLKAALQMAETAKAAVVVAGIHDLSPGLAFTVGVMMSRRRQDSPFIIAELTSAKGDTRIGGSPAQRQTKKAFTSSSRRRKLTEEEFSLELHPLIRALQADGITTLQGLATVLAARNIKTRGGGAWTAALVGRVLKKIPT